MNTFEEMLKSIGFTPCKDPVKYSSAGNTYHIDQENFRGIYWFYETDAFIIDIHDFFIKKDTVIDSFPEIKNFMTYISTYVITGNGEWLNPYQNLTSNTVFVMNVEKTPITFLLHGNFPYLSVGLNFKEPMIDECIVDQLHTDKHRISDIFYDTRELVTKPMGNLANSILNCTMDSPSADLFFEAKAKEWLSITLNAYLKSTTAKPLSYADEKALENVSDYINDHYAIDTPRTIYEKISMMSGTKLKTTFKQKYNMSITEYTQRKRMNMAETLLLTTELEIKDIAKSVGYDSRSRFTTLFKRYKGVYPKEVKRLAQGNRQSPCSKETFEK